MSIQRTRETIAAFVQDVSKRGPYGRHFAADVTLTNECTDNVIAGRAAVEQCIRQFLEQTFDASLKIKLAVVNDDQAIMEADLIGSHRSEFRGIAATGKEISIPCGVIYDLRDGEITALHSHVSIDLLLQQLR